MPEEEWRTEKRGEAISRRKEVMALKEVKGAALRCLKNYGGSLDNKAAVAMQQVIHYSELEIAKRKAHTQNRSTSPRVEFSTGVTR